MAAAGYGALSPAAVAAAVNSRIGSIYQPQIAQLRGEQTAADQSYGNDIGAANQLGVALAKILQPVGGEVGQAYTDAANSDASYAKGFSDMIAHLTGNSNLGDVLYGMKGDVPATALQTEGAAFQSAADQLPQTAGALANEEVAKITGAQTKTDASYAKELSSLLGNEGKESITYQNDLANQAYKGIASDLAAKKFGLSEQNHSLAVSRLQWSELHGQETYGLSLQRLLQSEKNRSTLSASEYSNLTSKLGQQMQKWYLGTPGKSILDQNGQRQIVGGQKALTYQQAIRAATAMFPRLPASDVIRIANSLYGPGEGGRPTLTPQQQALDNQLFGGTAGGQSTGLPFSPSSTGPSKNAGGFLPNGASFTMGRHDQGRDIQTAPNTPIIAPGEGYVVAVKSDPGGSGDHFGPAYPVVHFTSGPYAGQDVYIGHTVSALQPGQTFVAGQVLSRTQDSGPMNGGAPSGWAEIGFAPGGTPGPDGQPAPFGG